MSSSRWNGLKDTFRHCMQTGFEWLDQKSKTPAGKYFISLSTGAGVAFAIYGIGQFILPEVLAVKVILGIVSTGSFLIVSKAKYEQIIKNQMLNNNII